MTVIIPKTITSFRISWSKAGLGKALLKKFDIFLKNDIEMQILRKIKFWEKHFLKYM